MRKGRTSANMMMPEVQHCLVQGIILLNSKGRADAGGSILLA
jgi:hypothetical protein